MRLIVDIYWHTTEEKSGVWRTPEDTAIHFDKDYESPIPGIPKGWITYIWEEGNFSCDCNKAIMFMNDYEWGCGDKIKIDKMEPVEVVK